MELDVIIPIVIALAAIISPVLVAVINNCYQIWLKKTELKHELEMKEAEFKSEIEKQNFEKYYTDKKNAYDNLLKVAGEYSPSKESPRIKPQGLSSAASSAILYSNKMTRLQIIDFVNFANSVSEISGIDNPKEAYWSCLSDLATAFNDELEPFNKTSSKD